MDDNNSSPCLLYPCFDTMTGAGFKRDKAGRIIFDCAGCNWPKRNSLLKSSLDNINTIEKLYFLKIRSLEPRQNISDISTTKIIACLKNTPSLNKNMRILTGTEKTEALKIEISDKLQNIGIYSALKRDITVIFAHDSAFRDPPMPVVLLVKDRDIIGEMTSTGPKLYKKESDFDYILPPIDFPEAEPFGKDIVSASPGYLLDAWIRKKIVIKEDDATLILGLNLKQ